MQILKCFTYYLTLVELTSVEANYDFQSSFGAPIELKRVSTFRNLGYIDVGDGCWKKSPT